MEHVRFHFFKFSNWSWMLFVKTDKEILPFTSSKVFTSVDNFLYIPVFVYLLRNGKLILTNKMSLKIHKHGSWSFKDFFQNCLPRQNFSIYYYAAEDEREISHNLWRHSLIRIWYNCPILFGHCMNIAHIPLWHLSYPKPILYLRIAQKRP